MLDKLNVKNRRIHQITVGHTLSYRAHCATKVLVHNDPSVVVALAASRPIGVAEKWTTKENVLWLPFFGKFR